MDTSGEVIHDDTTTDSPENGPSPILSLSPYGGLGEDALGKRSHRSNSDVRVMARAIREEWDITPEKRMEVLDTLMHEMRHSDSAHLRIMAAKAIVAANAQNIAARNEGKQSLTVNIRELVLSAGPSLPPSQPAIEGTLG